MEYRSLKVNVFWYSLGMPLLRKVRLLRINLDSQNCLVSSENSQYITMYVWYIHVHMFPQLCFYVPKSSLLSCIGVCCIQDRGVNAEKYVSRLASYFVCLCVCNRVIIGRSLWNCCRGRDLLSAKNYKKRCEAIKYCRRIISVTSI